MVALLVDGWDVDDDEDEEGSAIVAVAAKGAMTDRMVRRRDCWLSRTRSERMAAGLNPTGTEVESSLVLRPSSRTGTWNWFCTWTCSLGFAQIFLTTRRR